RAAGVGTPGRGHGPRAGGLARGRVAVTTPREAWARLVAFVRRDALDRDFDEELAAHVEMATDEHIRQGLPPAEARRRTLARLGTIEASKQRHRETRGLPSLDGLLQ